MGLGEHVGRAFTHRHGPYDFTQVNRTPGSVAVHYRIIRLFGVREGRREAERSRERVVPMGRAARGWGRS